MNCKKYDPRRRTPALFEKLEKLPRQIANQVTPEAVHQLRTTIRRVETLVAANSTKTKHAKLLKQLKSLRRRAGRLRDIDVQLVALRGTRAGTRREKLEVRHALEKLQAKRARKLVKAIDAELTSGLRKRIKQTAAALTSAGPSGKPWAHAGALAMALDDFGKVAAEYPPLAADNLHAFRMRCKRMRYLAEMEADHPAADEVLKHFKRIQDAIGEWHDWVNLERTATDVLARPNSPLLAAVRAGRQAKFNEALRITGDAKARLLELRAAPKLQPLRAPAPVEITFKRQAAAG